MLFVQQWVSIRVFVFCGPWFFAWPSSLSPNLHLTALAPNLYLPALALDLQLPNLATNLCLPALAPNLYLLALASNLLFTSSGQDFTTTTTATCTITTPAITANEKVKSCFSKFVSVMATCLRTGKQQLLKQLAAGCF